MNKAKINKTKTNKVLYLTNQFAGMCGDPDGITCFITGEKVHYFDLYHDQNGEHLYVSLSISEKILEGVKHHSNIQENVKLTIEGIDVEVIDQRPYKTWFSTYNEPDYSATRLENDERWLSILPPEWYEVDENEEGIKNIAFQLEGFAFGKVQRTVGYNGILKGEKVTYEGKPYTIVMVSRLGDFGLSETGELPYIIRVHPTEVEKVV